MSELENIKKPDHQSDESSEVQCYESESSEVKNHECDDKMYMRKYKQYRAEWYGSKNDPRKNYSDISQNGMIEKEVKFYINDIYQYSLTSNRTRSDPCVCANNQILIEWIENEGKVYLIFKKDHGCISIFDANSGEFIHNTKNTDMFIYYYKLFDNDEYLYISGWFWNPFPMRQIFHIPTMLLVPDYEPIRISCDDVDDLYDVAEITLFGCSSCKEFIEKQDEIFKEIDIKYQTNEFNKNRTKDILLKRFKEDKELVIFNDNTRSLLENILSSDRTRYYVKTYDNISGFELGYNHVLSKKLDTIENDNFYQIVTQAIFCVKYYFSFPEINLTFSINTDTGNLNITVKHKLILSDKKISANIPFYNLDPSSPFKIICCLSAD